MTKSCRVCPHCGQVGCQSCAVRSVATQPTREEPAYWRRGRHFPDHGGTGLYGNGWASEGPEDCGNQLWGLSLDRWMEDAEQSVESAGRMREYQAFDAGRRLVEHLAIHPEVVTLLRLNLMRGTFLKGQSQEVRRLIRESEKVRSKLLAENSVLAATLRSRRRVA